MPQTLYEKIWNEHIVHQLDDGTTITSKVNLSKAVRPKVD